MFVSLLFRPGLPLVAGMVIASVLIGTACQADISPSADVDIRLRGTSDAILCDELPVSNMGSEPVFWYVNAPPNQRFLVIPAEIEVAWHDEDERTDVSIPLDQIIAQWGDQQAEPVGLIDHGLWLTLPGQSLLITNKELVFPGYHRRFDVRGNLIATTRFHRRLVFLVPSDRQNFRFQFGRQTVRIDAELADLPFPEELAEFEVIEATAREEVEGRWHRWLPTVGVTDERYVVEVRPPNGRILDVTLKATPRIANADQASHFILSPSDFSILTEEGAWSPARGMEADGSVVNTRRSVPMQQDGEPISVGVRCLFMIPDEARSVKLLYHLDEVANIDLKDFKGVAEDTARPPDG